MTTPVDLSAEALARIIERERYSSSQSLIMAAALQQIVAMSESPEPGKPLTTLERINRIAREGSGS